MSEIRFSLGCPECANRGGNCPECTETLYDGQPAAGAPECSCYPGEPHAEDLARWDDESPAAHLTQAA